jgi:spore coat protein CotF
MNEIIKDLENKYKDDKSGKIILTTLSSLNSQIEDNISIDVKPEFNLLFKKIYDDFLAMQELLMANPELKTILVENCQKMYVSYITHIANVNTVDVSHIFENFQQK